MKISIISPSRNHARYLRQNLESLLDQTYREMEVIVVNDASTDETPDVIEEFAKRDSRVRTVHLKINRGVMGAFNEGYKLVTGQMIYGSASDDYLCNPNFLEMVASSMRKAPQAAGVFGQADMISAETGKSNGLLGGIVDSVGYVSAEKCREAFFKHQALIPGVSCVWRKDLVDSIGGYPEVLGPQSDYFVNHALACLHGVVFLPKTVAVHRMSPKSYNADLDFKQRMKNYVNTDRKFAELGIHNLISPEVLRQWRIQLVDNFLFSAVQMHLFTSFRKVIGQLHPEFWNSVPDRMKQFFSGIPKECDEMEKLLVETREWAIAQFGKTLQEATPG